MKRSTNQAEQQITEVLKDVKLSKRQREYELLRSGRSVDELVFSSLLKETAKKTVRCDPLDLVGLSFQVEWCYQCKKVMVICPCCGNNTCNGGHGNDGKCTVCDVAYDVMHAILGQDGPFCDTPTDDPAQTEHA